jgi:hypothetical protein
MLPGALGELLESIADLSLSRRCAEERTDD